MLMLCLTVAGGQGHTPALALVQHHFPSYHFQDSISLLLEAVRTKNEELAQTWKKSEQWATIEQLCSKKGGSLWELGGSCAMGWSWAEAARGPDERKSCSLVLSSPIALSRE